MLLGYGMASSFAGESGLPRLIADMNRLMDTILDLAGETSVRFLMLSPIRHLPSPVPLNTDAHNGVLTKYARAIQEVAAKREAAFVSVMEGDALRQNEPPLTLSENGI